MTDLLSVDKIDFSSENLPKIFESQRKNIKQDILFLKEDILKDFREIENKLNTKYEKQNSNTVTKLHKFEISIEAMKNQIFELSTLISTDKNIQQKVLNLQEFKTKVSDKLIKQDLSIGANETMIKEAINRYDKILNESILYQGVIGNNARFQTFHHLIDFLLLNINQFVNFKDKNMIDFKSYKTKLESLFKAIKVQADSIVTTNNKYTNKRIIESEKRLKELITVQDAKIYDIRLESNNCSTNLDNKFQEMNKEIRELLMSRGEKFDKLDEEIDLLKDYNKGVAMKFENNENEIKYIKEKLKLLNSLDENIKNMKNASKKELSRRGSRFFTGSLEFSKNLKLRKPSDKALQTHNFNSINNSNRFARRGTIAKSIVKKYITGEIGISEIERSPLKRQKSTVINENEITDIMNSDTNNQIFSAKSNKYNNSYSLENISKAKRLTIGPDKFQNMVMDKNLLNKIMDINSEKNELDKSDNCISEEKSEDNECLSSSREGENDKENNSKRRSKNASNDEGNKNEDSNNKDNKNGNKIYLLKYKNKNDAIQTDIINSKRGEGNNINYQNKSTKGINRSISYEKINTNRINGLKHNTIHNQKQLSTIGRLHQIGGVEDLINNNNSNTNRLNRTNILFYDKNMDKFYNFKKRNIKNKLNIIEVNFEEPKQSYKEDNELKSIIKKIRENRIYFFSERNNRPLDKSKKFYMSDSDAGYENNSMNGIPIPMGNNHYFYNKMINDELQNYNNSVGYLNYIKNNKKIINMRQMNISKKNGLKNNLFDL